MSDTDRAWTFHAIDIDSINGINDPEQGSTENRAGPTEGHAPTFEGAIEGAWSLSRTLCCDVVEVRDNRGPHGPAWMTRIVLVDHPEV